MNAIFKSDAVTQSLWFGNTLVTILVSPGQGNDGTCLIEHRMPYGESPPLHVHRNEDEVFHVLSGTLRLQVDGRQLQLEAGQSAIAPKGLPHSFRVESAEGAHVLTITRGGDFESMVRAASRPAQTADLPTPVAPSPEAIAALTRLCCENGIDIVGAPLA